MIVSHDGEEVWLSSIQNGPEASLIRLKCPIFEYELVALSPQKSGRIQGTERQEGALQLRLTLIERQVVGMGDENSRHEKA
jgi:hypothetical protein